MIFLLLEALCLAGLARLAVVYHRESKPAPRPKRMYEAVQVRPSLLLPVRPEGMASMKAEIALIPEGFSRPRVVEVAEVIDAPPGYVPAPPVKLRTRKEHEDWRFDTVEWVIARDSWFEGLPDDRAVMKVGSHRA